MAVITKEWLSSDAIDEQVLSNNVYSKGRNNADSADINMFKVNTSDQIEAGAELNMGSNNIVTSGTVDGVDVSSLSSIVGNLNTLSGVAANETHLSTFTGSTIPDNQTIKQALQALETYGENSRSLIENFEWYESSALDYVTDNTAAPATEVEGDVYVLSHDGGTPHADYDGASAGDVVKFTSGSWVATTPTTGMMISVDDEASSLRQWGGASWSQKYFESTTASTGLTKSGFDVQLADAATANGIQVSSGAIKAICDDTTTEINGSNQIAVKANGIGENELNNSDGNVDAQSFVLPTGYTAGAGTIAAGDTIDAAIRKLDGNITAITGYIPTREIFTLDGTDISNGYVDLAHAAVSSSERVWPVGGPEQEYNVDYTLSVPVAVTRVTFAGDLASKLVAGKKLVVEYAY